MIAIRIMLIILVGAILIGAVSKITSGTRDMDEELEAKAVLELVKSKLLAMQSSYSAEAELNFVLPESIAGHSYILEILPQSGNTTLLKVTLDNGHVYTATIPVEVSF